MNLICELYLWTVFATILPVPFIKILRCSLIKYKSRIYRFFEPYLWTANTNKVQKTGRYSSNKYSSQIKSRFCQFFNLICEPYSSVQFTNKVQKTSRICRFFEPYLWTVFIQKKADSWLYLWTLFDEYLPVSWTLFVNFIYLMNICRFSNPI